jgi:hypothetical protein
MADNKPTPQEKHAITVRKYVSYVAELRATGSKFPCNKDGTINKSSLAQICGTTRQAFQKESSKLFQILDKDIKEIGVENCYSGHNEDPNVVLERKAKDNKIEASKLRAIVEKYELTINELKSNLNDAHKKIRELESMSDDERKSIDEMLESGRRFYL